MNVLLKPVIGERKTTHRRLAQQQARLLRIRVALQQRIKRLVEDASEDTPGYSIHMADAATDSFDRDMTLGLVSFEQEALYEVDAALQRIENGTYGVCELTGRPIPWKRLEAVPWTRFSIEAEAQLETKVHPHIGARGTVHPDDEECLITPFDVELETVSGESTEDLPSRVTRAEHLL